MENSSTNRAGGNSPASGNIRSSNGFPQIDVLALIKMITEVAAGDKTPGQAAKDFAKPFQLAALVFAKEKAADYVKSAVSRIGLEELNRTNFADALVNEAESAAKLIRQFIAKQITEQELIERLGGSEMRKIADKVLSALGVYSKLGIANMSEVMKLPPLILAVTASAAAFLELRRALDDLALARKERLMIEAACRESIAMIREYRENLDNIVNQYLTERLETFSAGLAAMDRALCENDTDGYIRGNAEIQAILGYHMQFQNRSEFDRLIDSDEAFRL